MTATPEQLECALRLASKYVSAISASLQRLCARPNEHLQEPAWPSDGDGDYALRSVECMPLETNACVNTPRLEAGPVVTLPFLVAALAETNRLLGAIRSQLTPPQEPR